MRVSLMERYSNHFMKVKRGAELEDLINEHKK